MRGFLMFLVFSATLIAVLVFVAGPIVARPLVAEVVRAALPGEGSEVDVAVDVDGFDLLGGRVREIRISGESVEAGSVRIGSLGVTVQGIGIAGRDFASMRGTLKSVTVELGDGTPVTVPSVSIAGPSTNLRAVARLDPGAAEAMVARTLADAGLPAERVQLVEGGVEVELLGQRIMVPLAVADGAVVMPSVMGENAVPVIAPMADDAWRVVGLDVRPSGLDVEATVDARALLGA